LHIACTLNGLAAPARSESEEFELLQLQQGEAVFLKLRKILIKDSFSTFDSIPRVHATVNATRVYTPKVKGVTAKDKAALNIWLSWLSRNNKIVANLKLQRQGPRPSFSCTGRNDQKAER